MRSCAARELHGHELQELTEVASEGSDALTPLHEPDRRRVSHPLGVFLTVYLQVISIHGLIRADRIEMGRDADTGGQVRYVIESAKILPRLRKFSESTL